MQALLKKIHKHRDSRAHKSCTDILCTRSTDEIGQSFKATQSKFMERHKDNSDATTKVFRTAYECTKSHMPYTKHPRLMELQTLNGVNCGAMFCTRIMHVPT